MFHLKLGGGVVRLDFSYRRREPWVSEIDWFQEARQVSRLVLRAQDRTAAELMDRVRRTTGLSDYGPEPIEDALERLLSAYRSEGRLNLLGRIATHWDNLRLLTNRLILRERETAFPAILDRRVERPLFIMGLPRSGTSFLHRLLALDGSNQVLRSWQAVFPYPKHPAAGPGAGPERVQSDFRLFNLIAPKLRKVHPIDARAPQECVDFTAHSFRSPRFDATYDVPSYRRWLKQAGQADAYRIHKRFLQHLQGEAPRRWVLKSPDHVFSLKALRAAYPDALVVFSHRDPVKVLGSLAHMQEVWRRPFVKTVDRKDLGRQVASEWTEGAEQMVLAHSEALWPRSQVQHVHYRSFVADPLGSIETLYANFDMPVTPAFRSDLAEYVARTPNGGYGRNVYSVEDYGLCEGEQREAFKGYVQAFDVEEEPLRRAT